VPNSKFFLLKAAFVFRQKVRRYSPSPKRSVYRPFLPRLILTKSCRPEKAAENPTLSVKILIQKFKLKR
jgi:hypothetical protein